METIISTCKNCGHAINGKYCSACGQKVYTHHDKKVSHFFEEGLHFLTHFEGSFFTTLKTIFSRPGKLSLEYCDGIRKKYFKPLSFFLLLVVVYLLFPAFEGLNMRLHYYATHPVIGAYASQKIAALLEHQQLSPEQLADKFHQQSEKASKFLLLVIIPFTALLCYLMTFKKRRYFFDQMIFSAEVSSLFLLWTFLLLGLLFRLSEIIYKAIVGHFFELTDNSLGSFAYGTFAVFVFVAARRFYAFRAWQTILFTLGFLIGFYVIVNWLYKFLLFALVINQIH